MASGDLLRHEALAPSPCVAPDDGNERYLVYRCSPMGLGHVIVSIFNCLRAAHDSGRTLAVDLTDFLYFRNIFHERTHERFFENFGFEIPPGVRLETGLARVKAICADPDRYEPRRANASAVSRPERVVVITHTLINDIHTAANKTDFSPCRLTLRGELAARVAPSLLGREEGTVTIGIYFRSGNGEFLHFRFDPVSMPDYTARYQELLSRYVDVARMAARGYPGKRVRYFVASDSAEFVQAMRRGLGEVLSRGDGGINGHHYDTANQGFDAVAEMLIDSGNLSACDMLIYSPSQFADLAVLNSETLTPADIYQLQLSTVPAVVAALPANEGLAYLARGYWLTPWYHWSVRAGFLWRHAEPLDRLGRSAEFAPLKQRANALTACHETPALRSAYTLFAQRQPAEALAAALAGAPMHNGYALSFIATLEAFMGNHSAALARVRDALVRLPIAPELYLLESQLLAALGDPKAAAAAAARGLAACGPEPPLKAQRALMASCLRPDGVLVNVAINKPAEQSSRSRASHPQDPQGAVNGVFALILSFHTDYEENPWWAVDLGAVEGVRRVIIYNRDDTLGDSADGLILEGGKEGTDYSEIARATHRFSGKMGGDPWDLWFDAPIPLRHIRLRLEGPRTLHLQQVEVYAEEPVRQGAGSQSTLVYGEL